MTMTTRVFSVSDFAHPSKIEPIRSVVLETNEAIIVAWYVDVGQEIAAHLHPQGQDTWTVIEGSADYYLGNGKTISLKAGEIAVAKPGQVHGAINTDPTKPFIFVSVVTPGNAGFALAEK